MIKRKNKLYKTYNLERFTMSINTFKKPLAIAMSATFVAAMAASPVANADSNPFGMQSMASGYMQLAEGKCGEGKCGGKKVEKAKEAKCGEGKCGDDKKMKKEGKCGEGKCGDDKKMKKEGKCGEGKCGDKK